VLGAEDDAVPVVDEGGRPVGLVTLRHHAELAMGVAVPEQVAAEVRGTPVAGMRPPSTEGNRAMGAAATTVADHVAVSGRHGSLGSGLAGHSSSRAPRTAAWSENRSSGLATL
jgi:hypothetical protein